MRNKYHFVQTFKYIFFQWSNISWQQVNYMHSDHLSSSVAYFLTFRHECYCDPHPVITLKMLIHLDISFTSFYQNLEALLFWEQYVNKTEKQMKRCSPLWSLPQYHLHKAVIFKLFHIFKLQKWILSRCCNFKENCQFNLLESK